MISRLKGHAVSVSDNLDEDVQAEYSGVSRGHSIPQSRKKG